MDDNSKRKRLIYTHNHLIGAAEFFERQATQATQKTALSFNAMGCALFCALALEASLNYIGKVKFEIWEKHLERKLNPKGKLALIASYAPSYAQEKVNPGKRPFQSFG